MCGVGDLLHGRAAGWNDLEGLLHSLLPRVVLIVNLVVGKCLRGHGGMDGRLQIMVAVVGSVDCKVVGPGGGDGGGCV